MVSLLIQTQQLAMEVIVNNQETVVLGGIYEQTSEREEAGVPVLRKIPVLGGLLFRHPATVSRTQVIVDFCDAPDNYANS